MKTKVLFLIDKPEDQFTGDHERGTTGVFAYFPEVVHNGELKTCYSHIGQHSACHPDYAKECKEATPDQYADLKKELEGLGYNLNVINSAMKTLYAERITETEGIYKGYRKTILRDDKGDIVSTYPAGYTQPHKAKKTIIHNCFCYNLVWQTPSLQ